MIVAVECQLSAVGQHEPRRRSDDVQMQSELKFAATLFSAITAIVIASCSSAGDLRPTAAHVCPSVANALSPSRESKAMPLYVESVPGEGRLVSYQGVDLDRDGLPDRLVQDCGSPSEGSCTLNITLSRGGVSYAITEAPFRVVRYQDRYYVLVGDRFPNPTPKGERQLFLLKEDSAALICKSL
jgi:hypothetical protein